MVKAAKNKDKHSQQETNYPEFLPAALFFTTSAFLPQGVRARDRSQFVSGLVEEHSPLPLDQTAWGYLAHIKNRKAGRLFYYAAPRELVNEHLESNGGCPLLPSFAALSGVRFAETTWLFFRDDHCLSAIRFPKNELVPDKVLARFLNDSGSGDAAEWQMRQSLEDSVVKPDVASRSSEVVNILPGIIRANCEVLGKGKRLRFTLFQSESPGQSEITWKTNEVKAADFVLAADLRDYSAMAEKHQGAETEKRILIGMVASLAGLLALGAWEFKHWQKASEVRYLEAQISERAPRVERLQEIEAMQQAVDALFRRNFEPFDWLMVINELRPPEVAFLTFALEDRTQMVISGQAGEITPINTFADAVRNDPRFTSATLSQVQTTREGATFNLRVETGDRGEAPVLVREAATPAVEPSANRVRRNANANANANPARARQARAQEGENRVREPGNQEDENRARQPGSEENEIE
jgi:hypothetical protein